jgi:hypothetical protein
MEILRPKPRNLKNYLVAVVSLAVLFVLLLDFLFLWCFVDVVSVVAVFCAKTTVPDSNERPRAAIMIFFIFDISL